MNDLTSRPLVRLVAVVGLQVLILLAIIGFKQYTVATADTILLATAVDNPSSIVGSDRAGVRFEISALDDGKLAGDDFAEIPFGGDFDTVYVELQDDGTGVWRAVAIHDDRERTFAGTVLIAGRVEYYRGDPGESAFELRYGIEDVFIPDDASASVPTGRGHEVLVNVRVDRFGHADPRGFLIDGQPFDLNER